MNSCGFILTPALPQSFKGKVHSMTPKFASKSEKLLLLLVRATESEGRDCVCSLSFKITLTFSNDSNYKLAKQDGGGVHRICLDRDGAFLMS